MCQKGLHQATRWSRIRGAGIDSGRILRFSFGPCAGIRTPWKENDHRHSLPSFALILLQRSLSAASWKNGPRVTFHFQKQPESAWFSYMAFLKQKRCCISVSMVARVWIGVGFSYLKNFRTRSRTGLKNFGTGAELEFENGLRPPLPSRRAPDLK